MLVHLLHLHFSFPLQVPPELHNEMFMQAKKQAEAFGVPALQDMFKQGFDVKGVANSIFGK